METIFIQIASYRDPELRITIKDCIKKAKYPERLSFGICWQYNFFDECTSASFASFAEKSFFITDKNCIDVQNKSKLEYKFIILPIHWSESKGVCWARGLCNKMYRNEDYFLQIDSHMRFDQDWDEKIIDAWKQCKHPKAVLTGYPPGYDYDSNGKEVYMDNMPLMTMVVKNFDFHFIPTFKSAHVFNSQLNRPCRGSFIAAGFLFTVGRFCQEVPYIEDIYFTGEEIVQSLRLFTYGYRVFYPHKWLIYHLYERKSSHKHWEDFINDKSLKLVYEDLQTKSFKMLYSILNNDPDIKNVFGHVNSFEDFENFSGLKIREKIIHPKQLKGFEPPIETSFIWNV